jgi:CheY-like chemotaxis protein
MAKILVVEDDDMLMDLMRQTLELSDHLVAGAGNGVEALERVKVDPPDLILMDIGMPLMDGYEAMRRLRADPKTRVIPIIALTAHASVTDRKQALDAGADDYEAKPVDFDRLEAKIQLLLRRSAP